MILSNEKRCRKNWFVQKSLHIKKKHVDPRRFKDWRAFWLTLARASKGFTAAGQRRNFTVLSPFPSQADPWETRCLNLSPFSPNENRFHICVSKRFADGAPATPLVDWRATTTNQAGPSSRRIQHSEEGNLEWLAGNLNEEEGSPRVCLIHECRCKRAAPRDSSFEYRSLRVSRPEQMTRRQVSSNQA